MVIDGKQEAEKKIELKRLPRVLTLHLKRFKYVESLDSFSKLSHRVMFPLELRAPNMTDGQGEADADDRLYRQVAIIKLSERIELAMFYDMKATRGHHNPYPNSKEIVLACVSFRRKF